MCIINPWDKLISVFGCRWDEEEIDAGLADNILIAWPSIIHGIERHFRTTSRLYVLDFGCGGGLFCRELYRLGNYVTGYEPSEKLLEAARLNVPGQVCITNSKTVLEAPSKYDIISSIMVSQFISNIDSVIVQLLNALRPGGLFIQAVFNPLFVLHVNNRDRLFKGFNGGTNKGVMEMKAGVEIPLYIRSRSNYCQLFSDLGYEEVYYDCPHFTREYLAKYRVPFSTDEPEFLIQGFTKRNC